MTTTTQHTSHSARKRAKAIVVRECAVRGGITRLAKAIGVGVPTVHRWARGETLPYAYHARLILERLA